jgi:hypothetical protein
MPTKTAENFHNGCDAIQTALNSVPESLAATPWRPDGWTRLEVLGHMIDSAANNHQRFVRAALDGSYVGPFYQQDGWVAAHGYKRLSWPQLLHWWTAYHEILKAVVAHISEEKLTAKCVVGDNEPVTLQFLIEDYIAHQQHHLKQILTT